MSMQGVQYRVVEQAPTLEAFCRLRLSVGWGEVDSEAAQMSLQNSLYWVCALDGEEVIGCGRVIGDGGLCFYIQDIIVSPAYQGQRLGRAMMVKIMAYVEKHARKGSFVGLMAADRAEDFYLPYGFIKRPSKGYGPGMIRFF